MMQKNNTNIPTPVPPMKWRRRLWWGLALVPVLALLDVLLPPPLELCWSPVLTDRKGEVLHAGLNCTDKWRLQTLPEDIPPLLEHAILRKEDRYFYYHPGVNPLAIGRALLRNIWRGRTTSGASTITMQVVRLLEPRPRHLGSKAVEVLRALQLERRLSKREILALYLSLAPYGGNIEGIAAASWLYLGKAPNHLSLAEIAALSVIPNRPNSLRPGRHNAAITTARNHWLHYFARHGLADSSTLADALAEPWAAQRRPAPRQAPHAARLLLQGSTGPYLHSTLDPQVQHTAEQITEAYIRIVQHTGVGQAAVLVVHNATRQVLAYVGSANFWDLPARGQVDGTRAIRQPGSTLKPFAYGLAIDKGLVTPKTMLPDVPINHGGYVPENYDLSFSGEVSMEKALSQSLNIPAVQVLQQTGTDALVQLLAQCHFAQVQKDQQKLGLSMVLGGCGTTLQELTGLYCMLANNGVYAPLRYTLDSPATAPALPPQKRLLSTAACYMLHDILSQPNRPDLPVHWSHTQSLPRIAWKTGTSYGRRDGWSIGYNPTYTIGVWTGHFDSRSIPALSGADIATPLLFRLFTAIDRQSHTLWYPAPADVDFRMVCAESGLLPGPLCTDRVSDLYIPLVSSMATCTTRQEVAVHPAGLVSYCPECQPAAGFVKKVYRFYPPEVAAYHQQHGIATTQVPPHYSGCQRVWASRGPQVTSPRSQATYYLSRSFPEPLALACVAEPDVRMVHWYINDVYYKSSPAAQQVFYQPTGGSLKVTCTDDKGRSRTVKVQTAWVD